MFGVVAPGFGIIIRCPIADRDSRPVGISCVIDTAISGLQGGQFLHPVSSVCVTAIVRIRAPRTENDSDGSFGKNGHGAE